MSTARRDFLFELGTEELPPKALPELERALAASLTAQLQAAGLAHGALESFATPRRLAVRVRRLAEQQPDQLIKRRGPPLRAAFDAAGQPTRAATAFAASCNVALADLGRERDDQGNEYLYYSGSKPGQQTIALLPAMVQTALDALPIPKRMRWGAGEAQFVRPVHWLVLLFGNEVIAASLLDTASGQITRGHRFMAPKPLRLSSPASYEKTLLRGKVIAGFAARRERIRNEVSATAVELGGRAVITDALLDEVTALVEWPVPVAGQFESRFLALPREVLISTLQDHQRYFPVEDAGGKLLPWFITVSNIESRDVAVVRAGNERVVRPRLSDAAFFWEQDRRQPLAARGAGLDRVTFQAKLGSIGDKSRRTATLAAGIAARVGAEAALVARAAALCKCDLLSQMVGEFPELQGIMGRYYALADGEPAEVAEAIREHYLPRGAGDELPGTATGVALALADKLDTLAGIFSIGQKPTGTKDPFGLRRAAIGVLRIIEERRLPLSLAELCHQAMALQPKAADAVAGAAAGRAADPDAAGRELLAYILERLRAQHLEAGSATTEQFDAVLATGTSSPLDIAARLKALTAFLAMPEAASLTAANKRIANILKKSEGANATASVDARLLQHPAEQALAAALDAVRAPVQRAIAAADYGAALRQLAGLRASVDAFFDQVLVNDPDMRLRNNRLALLAGLRQQFAGVADLSRLPG